MGCSHQFVHSPVPSQQTLAHQTLTLGPVRVFTADYMNRPVRTYVLWTPIPLDAGPPRAACHVRHPMWGSAQEGKHYIIYHSPAPGCDSTAEFGHA